MMILWPGISCDSEVEQTRRCQQRRRVSHIEPSTPSEETVAMADKSVVESKPKQPMFAVGDTEAKLSIAYAMKQEYRIVLDTDGDAEVTNPDGRSYYIRQFTCDCPDKRCRNGSYSGACKHEIWINQMRPCEMCGAVMFLGEFKTAFGEILRVFECPACGNARGLTLVKAERKAIREGGSQDDRLTPGGRCRQAIAWKKADGKDRYVWSTVRQCPELAPVMVRLLARAGEGKLADALGKAFGVAGEQGVSEEGLRERLRKARVEILKQRNGYSIFTGLLEHHGVRRLEDLPVGKLPGVLSFCEQLCLPGRNGRMPAQS